MANSKKSEIKVKEQIKFAVVMYGGGSLAIYINGVAQELLRLVQSTAKNWTAPADGDLTKTTDIYRKVAFLLSDREKLDEIGGIEDKTELKAELDKFCEEAAKKQPNVSFVIDVLTGSSAGGINAVFLSKALVRGIDGMDDLQRLWIEQGDFAKLLNDKKSVADNPLNPSVQPASLLNSQRMYLELLKALEGMDTRATPEKRMVEELDLYVTYTDFRGVPLPMFLSDKAVLERRHKHVFNFRYSSFGMNDFENDNNPFLAFAARTTSSFPFAFEPSRLIDIDEVLTNAMPTQETGNSDNQKWTKYFRELTDEHGKPIDWKTRSFVDGGALDNKPFSYAIDKLTQRADEGIVHRKLLYIEPAPEDLSNEKNSIEKPNAIANLLAQGVNLPRYETIREDIQRLLERNRLIRRMNRITADVERDFEKNFGRFSDENFPDKLDWSEAGLNDVIKSKGISALPYYRLRISAVTDDIAKMTTSYFRVDEDSDYFKVFRSMIAIWRDDAFAENSVNETGGTTDNAQGNAAQKVRTLNKFLHLYDVEYRFRRLRFIMRKIEDFLRRPDEIYEQLLNYTNEKIIENLLARPDETVGKLLTDTGIEDLKAKYEQAKGKIKTAPQNDAESADKKIETESGTAVDAAITHQEGLVSTSSAIYNIVPVDDTDVKLSSKRKGAVKVEDLSPEDKNLKELTEKRSAIEKMDFKSVEFITEAINIQKQVNEIYQRLRREHAYLHTGLENPQLADDLLKEIDKKARLADPTANDAEVAENNLQNFMLTLGDVEQELQSLEILQQKADGATAQETDFKLEILDKHIRIQKNQREKKDVGNQQETLSAQEQRILKELSFAALNRILRCLKKDEKCKTFDNDGKTYGNVAGKGMKALENAYGDGFKRILRAFDNSAFFLEGVYNEPGYFIKRASEDMKKLLNIENENSVSTANNNTNFIRDYLKVYYPIFDSYDQISFPVYFETSVGEAVEVDIVRISSRDAHSLINEENPEEKRRKLAGDALYAFGAFLDPRWRINDIMWGRLDGAERLITTLLPDEEHKNLRDVLIEEANTVILREILLNSAKEDFQGIAVDMLTFAGTEAIAQKAVDKLVQGLTKSKIKAGLSSALVNTLKEDIIHEQVRSNYEVNRSPDPEPTLKILSRATQVTGKILESIADENNIDSGRISWIAKLGQVFWGLVTVAVPNTMWNLVVNYWLQLIYMFEVVVIIGSTILVNQTVQQFGFAALIVTVAFHLSVITLEDLMRGSSFLNLLKWFFIVLIIASTGIGIFFFYAMTFGDKELWEGLVRFRNTLSSYDLWQRVFALIVPGILIIAVIGWRELKNRYIRSFGSALLALLFILLASGVFMDWAVKPLPDIKKPIIELEFANAEKVATIRSYSEATDDLKTALIVDSFIFIPVYVCLFLLLAQLLAFRRRRWFGNRSILFFYKPKEIENENAMARVEKPLPKFVQKFNWRNAVWLGIIAAILFGVAGIADGIENFYSYKVLSVPIEQLGANPAFLTIKTSAAAIKFLLTFIGIALLSLNFYRKPNRSKSHFGLFVLFFILLLTSIIGIIFTVIPNLRDFISLLLTAQIGITLVVAIVLMVMNKNFLKDF